MYKIEKGIEIPESKYKVGKAPMYPFKTMNIGDSFFVPAVEGCRPSKKGTSILGTARRHAPMKFIVRSNQEGTRCWRVK